jgi:hypothetical protein
MSSFQSFNGITAAYCTSSLIRCKQPLSKSSLTLSQDDSHEDEPSRIFQI